MADAGGLVATTHPPTRHQARDFLWPAFGGGDLRSLTPDSPPFSSMNSTPAAGTGGPSFLMGSSRCSAQSSLLETNASPRSWRAVAESRTPGLSPLVNSTPAVSSALTKALTVEACADRLPGFDSSRFTVGSDTEEASAS